MIVCDCKHVTLRLYIDQ